KNGVDLADQMIRWHHLVEIKGIKELALSGFPSPHHAPLPLMLVSNQRNHGSRVVSTGVLQHIPPISGHLRAISARQLRANSGHRRLFDHLVGAIEQRTQYVETKRPSAKIP